MNRERLEELVRACVHRGEVTLASGKKSNFYVDGRLVTLTPEGSRLLGEELLDIVQELRVSALAGPTTGACPLVSATGVLAAQAGVPLKLAYVRGAPKGHGLQKRIEGPPLDAKDTVLVVDDVLTSGGSLLRAIEAIRAESDARVAAAFVIVDRQAGGAEALAAAGVPLRALFTRADLAPAKA